MTVKEGWESPKGKETQMVHHSRSVGGRGTNQQGSHSNVAIAPHQRRGEQWGGSRKCPDKGGRALTGWQQCRHTEPLRRTQQGSAPAWPSPSVEASWSESPGRKGWKGWEGRAKGFWELTQNPCISLGLLCPGGRGVTHHYKWCALCRFCN